MSIPGLSLPVVRDVSFDVIKNSAFGLIGESGSGKSLTCRAIVGLLPQGISAQGEVLVDGIDVLSTSDRGMRAIRGNHVGMIFQDPMSSLNPLTRVGDLVRQVVQSHSELGRTEASRKAIDLLRRVGISNPESQARKFPHQFSGGMRQRVAIAMALAAEPSFLLADEPTSSLDVIVQAGILELLNDLKQSGMGLVFVSHDFAVVAEVCEFVGVMYAGQLVEVGETSEVLQNPKHPYTIGLLQALPSLTEAEELTPISGRAPAAGEYAMGCTFFDRCELATAECIQGPIELIDFGGSRRVRCIHTDSVRSLWAEAGDKGD